MPPVGESRLPNNVFTARLPDPSRSAIEKASAVILAEVALLLTLPAVWIVASLLSEIDAKALISAFVIAPGFSCVAFWANYVAR